MKAFTRIRPLVSTFLLFICCTGGGNVADPTLFRYRINSDPPTLDPAHSTDTVSASMVLKIFDGLVQFNEKDMSIIPAVAREWTVSPDGKVYTFHLRTDCLFHNGRKVTADDFRYSFERVLAAGTASERRWVLDKIAGATVFTDGKTDHVNGISVKNDSLLVLTLSEPYAPFLAQLCMDAASVVPREAVEAVGDDRFTQQPVGCGPFRFVKWDPDREIILEAFEEYYGQKSAYVKKLVFKVISNVNVALEAYKNGELDLLDEIPPGQVALLKKTLPDDIHIRPVLGTYYFCFNHERPPFKDNKKLRQAFNYAIDKETVSRVINEGVSTPARGILPPGVPGASQDLPGYPYDQEKAKQLLSEAGYPDGNGLPEITLWYNTNEAHERMCQYVQASLKKIGVNVRLKNLDWAAYLKALEAGETAFCRMGWVADVPDPDNFLFILLHSSQHGAAGNFSRYSNPAFDRLVEQGRVEQDQAKRLALYKKAEAMAVEDACWLITHHYGDAVLIKPYWKNILFPPQGDFTIPVRKLKR